MNSLREAAINLFRKAYLMNIHLQVTKKHFTDGSWYEGQIVPGRRIREGYGIYSYADGDCYLGQWVADQFEGEGTYIFSTG